MKPLRQHLLDRHAARTPQLDRLREAWIRTLPRPTSSPHPDGSRFRFPWIRELLAPWPALATVALVACCLEVVARRLDHPATAADLPRMEGLTEAFRERYRLMADLDEPSPSHRWTPRHPTSPPERVPSPRPLRPRARSFQVPSNPDRTGLA